MPESGNVKIEFHSTRRQRYIFLNIIFITTIFLINKKWTIKIY